MVAGRKYWIVIWYGILFLGLLGLWASVYWGRRTHWKNSEEVLRALGTILVSVGMLILLYQPALPIWETAGQVLLVYALICFIGAFILGRRAERERPTRPSIEQAALQLIDSTTQPGSRISGATTVSPDPSSQAAPPHSAT